MISGAQDAIVAQMIGGINNFILIGHQTSFTGKKYTPAAGADHILGAYLGINTNVSQGLCGF